MTAQPSGTNQVDDLTVAEGYLGFRLASSRLRFRPEDAGLKGGSAPLEPEDATKDISPKASRNLRPATIGHVVNGKVDGALGSGSGRVHGFHAGVLRPRVQPGRD